MLKRFIVSNFLSFNDEEEFSMIPGRTRDFKERIYSDGDQKLLKFSALYGANASGKSNFVNAIEFSQRLIKVGLENISRRQGIKFEELHYKLDPKKINEPTKFEYEILIEGQCYSYGFLVHLNEQKIIREWLIEINPTTEKMIFGRDIEEQYYEQNIKFSKQKDKESFDFLLGHVNSIEKSLLLTELIRKKDASQELDLLKSVYKWFTSTLHVILPEDKYFDPNFFRTSNANNTLVDLLKYFDTGIVDIETQLSSVEELKKYIPEDIIVHIINDTKKTKPTKSYGILETRDHLFEIITNSKEDEEITINEILFKHSHDSDVKFTYGQESDGTRRLIELINILQGQSANKVFVIDELDRSFHAQLTIRLIETYLDLAKKRDSQLVITTHEANLMDLETLRRDEIWFVDRDHRNNASHIYSLDEFNEHKTKKIVNSYFQGRYGAIPMFKNLDFLGGEVVAEGN